MIKAISTLIFIFIIGEQASAQLPTFLPEPKGEYYIGTENLFYTDITRKEKLTLKWGDKRRLQVKVWYPADAKGEIENMYLKDYSATTLWENYRIFNDSKSFFDSLKNYKTYSYEQIAVSEKKEKFPLIIFSPGYYFGLDDFYTVLMENLASHGYIVVSITHPYDQVIANTAEGEVLKIKKFRMTKAYLQWKKVEFMRKKNPDTTNAKQTNRILRAYLRGMKVFDRSVNLWTKDVQFVLDTLEKSNNLAAPGKFFGKIDFTKVGTLGQSVGGAVAGQVCYRDDRVKAGINLDCFQFGDLYQKEMQKPFMLLQSDSYPLWAIANKIIYANTNPFYSLNINNSRHFIFSDCSIFPVQVNEKMKALIGEGNNHSNIQLINDYIIDFYNYYLLQEPFKTATFQNIAIP